MTMTKIVTYVDSSVLIRAATKSNSQTFAGKMRALQVLNNKNRVFVASEFLRLEVLPIAKCYNKRKEITFYEMFFRDVHSWAPSEILIAPALDLACKFGLGALDALHLAAAKHFDAEFVSAEKTTKPIYRAYSNTASIY